MRVKVLVRSAGFKEILDARLADAGLGPSEQIDPSMPLEQQVRDAQVVVNGLHRIDRQFVDMCPDLELVHQAGIGFDNVDVAYCASQSVYVANVPLANSVSVAEHAIFLMMYLAKNMRLQTSPSDAVAAMRRRVPGLMGTELYGKTLLVVGLGATGSETAKRAKAFGMTVLAVTKDPVKPGRERSFFADEVKGPGTLAECLGRADYVSLHVPLNAETEGMMGAGELAAMKPSAYLINVARAPVVDRQALHDALAAKKLAGAAFDVFWEEPPLADQDDPLLKLDNFVLTPHVAGWTKESVDAIARIIAANIQRVAQGSAPLTPVTAARAGAATMTDMADNRL